MERKLLGIVGFRRSALPTDVLIKSADKLFIVKIQPDLFFLLSKDFQHGED